MNKRLYLALSCMLSLTIASCNNTNNSSYQNKDSSDLNSSIEEITSSNNEESSSSIIEESDSSIIEESVTTSSVEDSSSESSTKVDESSEEQIAVDVNFDFSSVSLGEPTVETKHELGDFTPTYIKASTFKKTTTSISDGVDYLEISVQKDNGVEVHPKVVIVDLNKADIVAGCYNNSTSTKDFMKKSLVYNQALAWERDNPGRKVLAGANGDYFAWGDTGNTVNAFVKDGVILKEKHNYDLNDVPVSSPMLFGVCKNGARIGPISTNTNYQENLNSSLTYQDKINIIDNKTHEAVTYDYRLNQGVINSGIGVIKDIVSQKGVTKNCRVYKYEVIQKDKSNPGEIRAFVSEMLPLSDVKSYVDVTDDTYGYIVVSKNSPEIEINVGDYIDITRMVSSVGDEWNGYTTIIGARHEILNNGEIPATVAQETSNGTNGPRARTAVGIMPDGKVMIVSLEEVNSSGNTDTTQGMNIKALADLMRYLGCYDACNFDGGGSSVLIARDLNGDLKVRNRSSDGRSYELASGRLVLNSILVVTK